MTHGYTQDRQKISNRLRRIEGQVRGIERMVEDDRYCIDILTQVGATITALESVGLKLLEDHTRHCVAEALASGRRRRRRRRRRSCSRPCSGSPRRVEHGGAPDDQPVVSETPQR
jgi:CsoR family transcriptional regulator, copper-sensing transcriptional repressor